MLGHHVYHGRTHWVTLFISSRLPSLQLNSGNLLNYNQSIIWHLIWLPWQDTFSQFDWEITIRRPSLTWWFYLVSCIFQQITLSYGILLEVWRQCFCWQELLFGSELAHCQPCRHAGYLSRLTTDLCYDILRASCQLYIYIDMCTNDMKWIY